MEHSTISLLPTLEPSLPELFNIDLLDSMDDTSIDLLPFGLILINSSGTILKYNLAEARLARLDRNQVIGKSFFRVVAPCTATENFEGRFKKISSTDNKDASIKFKYLFDFKFGAQEVDVEMVRSKKPDQFFICINRTKFREPRANLPQGFAAPLQRELAPEEEQQGITRDLQARRLLRFDSTLFGAMRATWDKLSPRGWEVFCSSWGVQWGRTLMIDLETECLEKADKSLRELPTKDALGLMASTLKGKGWGELSFDFEPSHQGAFLIRVNRSAIAESVGASETPRCQLLSGLFQAMFTTLSQQIVFAQEVACQSQGHPHCSFVLTHQSQRENLQRAAQSERNPERILAALKELHRGNL